MGLGEELIARGWLLKAPSVASNKTQLESPNQTAAARLALGDLLHSFKRNSAARLPTLLRFFSSLRHDK